MPGSLIHQIYLLAGRIANIGVSEGLSFHEKKKIQVINICISAGVLPKVFFGCLNFLQGKTLLGFINLVLLIGGVLILWMHHRKKYPLARLVMIFAASALFTASAILYRNGGEYYLMANLIIIIIFFNETKFLIGISFANCLLFLGIKIFLHSDFVYDTVPFSRIIFNIGWVLLMMVLALWFFKTEQRAYQKTIELKNQELEQINRSKEKIFSIIAHDLRSPIGQLKSSLDLVNREYISPEQFHQITSKLAYQVDLLHNTMDNLLRWSLSQLQGITAKPEKTELAPIIEHKLKLYQPRLEEKQLKLVAEGTDKLIWVDPDHLLLVLRNLLSNAIKYSYPSSTVAIRCQSDGHEVTIAVSDTGTGISQNILASLFHSDIIVSSLGTANERGTGLGLKLCREFIEKNNGRIYVESFENRGSTFYVSLPQAM
ncbi:MAG: HAMP domain-containing histidine kinase [Chitinophagaceae bacterium]|nr:HAMP domain-containing histidine kinase [Chitinophagaceae bacterium]